MACLGRDLAQSPPWPVALNLRDAGVIGGAQAQPLDCPCSGGPRCFETDGLLPHSRGKAVDHPHARRVPARAGVVHRGAASGGAGAERGDTWPLAVGSRLVPHPSGSGTRDRSPSVRSGPYSGRCASGGLARAPLLAGLSGKRARAGSLSAGLDLRARRVGEYPI